MEAPEGPKARVRFVTDHDAFRITDAPFVLPQKLGRYGLSEVVNHLLNSASSTRQPFDFSINGVLLRVQLKTFLQKYRVNLEEIVTIEYQPALSLSDEAEVTETPAWVGCLSTDGRGPEQNGGGIIAGCYDGSVQIARGGQVVHSFSAHASGQPIRALSAWGAGSPQGGTVYLATGSKDLTVKLWALVGGGPEPAAAGRGGKKDKQTAAAPVCSQVAELSGHVNSVESVDLWSSPSAGASVLLTGDWAGNLFGWSVGNVEEWKDEQAASQQSSSKKKMKTSDAGGSSKPTLRELKPVFTIRAHSQAVSSIHSRGAASAGGGAETRVLTASWDHSIKEWDLQAQDCVTTVVSHKVVTGLSARGGGAGGSSVSVVTAHPDGKVRLWDLRAAGGDCRNVFASSTAQWVSGVAWHPDETTAPHVFASADYAGVVRVWDTRSNAAPLGSTEAHDGKALCCAWEITSAAGAKIVSGGSDCRISSSNFD